MVIRFPPSIPTLSYNSYATGSHLCWSRGWLFKWIYNFSFRRPSTIPICFHKVGWATITYIDKAHQLLSMCLFPTRIYIQKSRTYKIGNGRRYCTPYELFQGTPDRPEYARPQRKPLPAQYRQHISSRVFSFSRCYSSHVLHTMSCRIFRIWDLRTCKIEGSNGWLESRLHKCHWNLVWHTPHSRINDVDMAKYLIASYKAHWINPWFHLHASF